MASTKGKKTKKPIAPQDIGLFLREMTAWNKEMMTQYEDFLKFFQSTHKEIILGLQQVATANKVGDLTIETPPPESPSRAPKKEPEPETKQEPDYNKEEVMKTILSLSQQVQVLGEELKKIATQAGLQV